MAAAETSSFNPPRPDLHRRQRRLVFDRRYGWIFDEWTDPAVSALSGGRGMFCILPMAQALMNAAASSVNNFVEARNTSELNYNFVELLAQFGFDKVNYAADSVSTALTRPEIISPLAHLPLLQFQRNRRTWFHELEQSGVIADAKLVPCRTLCALECISTDRD